MTLAIDFSALRPVAETAAAIREAIARAEALGRDLRTECARLEAGRGDALLGPAGEAARHEETLASARDGVARLEAASRALAARFGRAEEAEAAAEIARRFAELDTRAAWLNGDGRRMFEAALAEAGRVAAEARDFQRLREETDAMVRAWKARGLGDRLSTARVGWHLHAAGGGTPVADRRAPRSEEF